MFVFIRENQDNGFPVDEESFGLLTVSVTVVEEFATCKIFELVSTSLVSSSKVRTLTYLEKLSF